MAKTNWRAEARSAAKRHGLDPNIFERQIGAESNFDEDVIRGRRVSSAGAQGIAQIMPATAKSWGVNPLDPRAALNAAAKNMATYVRKYGSYENALRAYNAGPSRIEESKGFSETNNYVQKILQGRDPGKLGAKVKGGRGGTSAPTSMKTVVTGPPVTPGGATRESLLQQYVLNRGKPNALLGLATGISSLAAPTAAVSPITGSKPRVKASASVDGDLSGQLLELFWQGPNGINAKNGKRQPQGFVSGHDSHVHAAAPARDIVKLAKLAQSMGLNVGENPAYGGVAPVHVTNSNHYAAERVNGKKVGKAIDVSGDKKKLAAFAHKVAQMYGVK